MELAGETAPAEKAVSPDVPAADGNPVAGGEPAARAAGLIGALNADERIRAGTERSVSAPCGRAR